VTLPLSIPAEGISEHPPIHEEFGFRLGENSTVGCLSASIISLLFCFFMLTNSRSQNGKALCRHLKPMHREPPRSLDRFRFGCAEATGSSSSARYRSATFMGKPARVYFQIGKTDPENFCSGKRTIYVSKLSVKPYGHGLQSSYSPTSTHRQTGCDSRC